MSSSVVVLGGGVGGTLAANLIRRRTGGRAHVTVVDATGQHVYQPGFLYVAFGQERPEALTRPERRLLDRDVDLVTANVERIDTAGHRLQLAGAPELHYDHLVIASGSRTVMEEVPGGDAAHTFYTLDGAQRLRDALRAFTGGRILVGVAGIPYKCPPAPVEFVFMLDDHLRARGLRASSEIRLLSPLNRAFTIEATSEMVQPILAEREIELNGFFNVETVDAEARTVSSLEGETLEWDLLVLVPPHRGQLFVGASGLGDAQGWIPVDRHTLRHETVPDVWAIGDATNLPISKSGSVAHFQAPVVADQVAALVLGREPSSHRYDGRVMCFLETGRGQATTIRFDYDHPPRSPRPARAWHWAKAAFNKTYWHTVPQGRLPE